MKTKQQTTRTIKIGDVSIGGNHPVSIQSMTNTDTRDCGATIKQIVELEQAGCEIIRIAIPDLKAAANIQRIVKNSRIPVIADIHFDHTLDGFTSMIK